MSQEKRSIFWEVIQVVSVVLSKITPYLTRVAKCIDADGGIF
jgi:hypothetical protein